MIGDCLSGNSVLILYIFIFLTCARHKQKDDNAELIILFQWTAGGKHYIYSTKT